MNPSEKSPSGTDFACQWSWYRPGANALGHAHISAGTDLSRASCPSPPACGGRGRGPARRQPQARGLDPRGREGEVGGAAVRGVELPHLTPTLSAPKGGEGDNSAICLAVRSVHAPSAKAGSSSTAEAFGLGFPPSRE